jgi:hypothetical protein
LEKRRHAKDHATRAMFHTTATDLPSKRVYKQHNTRGSQKTGTGAKRADLELAMKVH